MSRGRWSVTGTDRTDEEEAGRVSSRFWTDSRGVSGFYPARLLVSISCGFTGRARVDPEFSGCTTYPIWPGNILGSPGRAGEEHLDDLSPDKRNRIRWMFFGCLLENSSAEKIRVKMKGVHVWKSNFYNFCLTPAKATEAATLCEPECVSISLSVSGPE